MSVNRREVLKLVGAGGAALIGVPAVTQSRALAATSPASATSSDVSFVGASSSGTRKKMIQDVLEPWRSTVTAGIAGKTIIVKPNLVGLGSSRPGGGDKALPCTHVDALRAVLDFLRSISSSAKIIIADSSAVAGTSSVWSGAGYTALTSEYPGVTLQDLNDATVIPTVNQTIWKPDLSATTTIPVSRAFADPKYYVISVTRPKTHDTLVMTGTTKNILMAAPMRSTSGGTSTLGPKRLMHGGASNTKPVEAKCLSYNVFQLANLLYPSYAPALSVLDAWEGMEGDGPVGGSSVLQYCAVAGTDSLAVDRLEAMLMGFSDTATEPVDTSNPSYTDMRYLKWISDAGLGNYDLKKINFVLGSLSAARGYIKKYKMHSNYASEVGWTGGAPNVLGSGGQATPLLDPRPFLQPQSGQVRADAAGFTFALPVGTGVRLGIFTAQGAEVRQLMNTHLSAGRYTVAWDGRDSHGSQVPAGSYVVRLGFGSRAAGAQERSLEDRITLTS